MLKTQSIAIGNAPDAAPERAWSNELRRGRVPGPRLPQHKAVPGSSGLGTMCVHAGCYEDPVTGAVTGTLFQSTTFLFSETSYASFSQGITRDVPIYTRYGNPNQWAVQEKIATLEAAESAIVFASGMAAIYSTLLALTNRGGHIISAYDVYGGTYDLLKEIHQIGRSVTLVDPTDIAAVEAAIREETQILFFETLSNPLLKAIPLRELSELAQRHKLLLIVDNTFLSPIFCRPLEHGADIVVHSGTKFLNGHSDLVAGVASGSRKYVDRIWQQSLRVGGQLEPIACYMLERGLKTLDLRMRRHAENAARIAAFLARHPCVEHVYHPTLDDYPHRWVDDYCKGGYGGLISFVVRGGDDAAMRFSEALTIPALATSLGGVESLVSLPFNTSHSTLTAKQREQMGIRAGLVRFSVGIEDAADLEADLGLALEQVQVSS
jgi:cystathionine beta-lyase/cystathionine gamma-synthase